MSTELTNLSSTLQDAHWAAHNDQQDGDHNFSDEQWAEILNKHEQAKADAFQIILDTESAFQVLRAGQTEWIRSSREKIAKLDFEISAKT